MSSKKMKRFRAKCESNKNIAMEKSRPVIDIKLEDLLVKVDRKNLTVADTLIKSQIRDLYKFGEIELEGGKKYFAISKCSDSMFDLRIVSQMGNTINMEIC